MGKQMCLEKKAIEERHKLLTRNDYVRDTNEFSENHKDCISDGDVKGKGNNSTGFYVTTPDCTRPSIIDYSHFVTDEDAQIGGKYDIEGRNGVGGRRYHMAINNYNKSNQYGRNLIDMEANLAEGQYSTRF
jgi:hypothetical protein